jgi:hypothetical protein
MPKSEITWKRVNEDGVKIQVNARQFGGVWQFSHREKRFDQWQAVAEPPLEDWLELLDAVQRYITRRRYQPKDEDAIRRMIRERFPDAGV